MPTPEEVAERINNPPRIATAEYFVADEGWVLLGLVAADVLPYEITDQSYGAAISQLANVSMERAFTWEAQASPYSRFVGDEHVADNSMHRTIYSLFNGEVFWPDEGYPCEICWSVMRWPWEPARSCPLDVKPRYCDPHKEMLDEL